MNERDKHDKREQPQKADARLPYEPPQLLKKRSVARVTLFSGFSGTGTSGSTLTGM